MGIEPTRPAWKAGVLPLNYTRVPYMLTGTVGISLPQKPENRGPDHPPPDGRFVQQRESRHAADREAETTTYGTTSFSGLVPLNDTPPFRGLLQMVQGVTGGKSPTKKTAGHSLSRYRPVTFSGPLAAGLGLYSSQSSVPEQT